MLWKLANTNSNATKSQWHPLNFLSHRNKNPSFTSLWWIWSKNLWTMNTSINSFTVSMILTWYLNLLVRSTFSICLIAFHTNVVECFFFILIWNKTLSMKTFSTLERERKREKIAKSRTETCSIRVPSWWKKELS